MFHRCLVFFSSLQPGLAAVEANRSDIAGVVDRLKMLLLVVRELLCEKDPTLLIRGEPVGKCIFVFFVNM